MKGTLAVLTSTTTTCLQTFAKPSFSSGKLACQPVGTLVELSEGPFEVYEPSGDYVWWGLDIGGYTVEKWMGDASEAQVARHACDREIDVRELDKNPIDFIGESCFTLAGEVLTISTAPEGYVKVLDVHGSGGSSNKVEGKTYLQINVPKPNPDYYGETITVMVLTDEPTDGIFEGSSVRVWATALGYATGENPYGGEIVQPVLRVKAISLQ